MLLGVTLDQFLSFDSHITALFKTCFYHIRALRHIRPSLSEGTANLIARCSCLFQAGLCQRLSVWHLEQESVSHTEDSKHTCSGCYILQTTVQHSPPSETPPLASSLSSDQFQNCSGELLRDSMPEPRHICHPSFVLMFLRELSALLVQINFVFHMSALYSARVGIETGRPYHLEFHAALRNVVLHYPYIQETT